MNFVLYHAWDRFQIIMFHLFQEQMVLRHHNEAESLNAVQKMDWEWKVNELLSRTASGSQKSSGKHDPSHQIDDLHIPMVHVSDDFDLANC